MPASLRAELRALDPAIVRGAIEKALAGANESARVSAVKLLADVDAFSRDGGCPVCAEAAAEREANSDKARASVTKLVVDSVVEILEGQPKTGLAHLAADLLDERQRRRLKDLRTLKLDQIRAASANELTREALAGA